MGIAVEILLLCALEFEICLGVKIPPVAGERRRKTVAGTRVKAARRNWESKQLVHLSVVISLSFNIISLCIDFVCLKN